LNEVKGLGREAAEALPDATGLKEKNISLNPMTIDM
jgi:hypothetical protein